MLPTLKPGQDVLVWCWFYKLKVGDIVAIKINVKEMIKRVRQMSSDRGAFVQGDNEKESTDSRNFGWINKKDIIGKVIWP
ncbi:S26 family signal peptidase [Candidatus Daviesbacteria bacterium]|nr:S26 family signal peptidase [Candidatus Daviesbacteria bacterium]